MPRLLRSFLNTATLVQVNVVLYLLWKGNVHNSAQQKLSPLEYHPRNYPTEDTERRERLIFKLHSQLRSISGLPATDPSHSDIQRSSFRPLTHRRIKDIVMADIHTFTNIQMFEKNRTTFEELSYV